MRPHFNNHDLSPEDLEYLSEIERFHEDENRRIPEPWNSIELKNGFLTGKQIDELEAHEKKYGRLK
jgi:hypothetical protein